MNLTEYEMQHGVPPDDDLDDIAADEPTGDDSLDPEAEPDAWPQPVNPGTNPTTASYIQRHG
jgi:hypothetical protein